MTEATILALVAIVGSVITALFKLLADNTKAQAKSAEAMSALVQETRKGNVEAAQRNGHLGEQNENITRLIVSHAEDSKLWADSAATKVVSELESVIAKQTVQHQTVQHQTVEEE